MGVGGAVWASDEPQDSLFDQVSVEMIPAGDVWGDGLTEVSLSVLMMDRNGVPMTGVVGKVTTTGGTVGPLIELKPGVYRVGWVPPLVDGVRDIEIALRGKTVEKEKFRRAWSIQVQPLLHQIVTVTASPAKLEVGRDEAASIQLTLTGGATETIDAADLVFRTSSGSISNMTAMGEGRYAAQFIPSDIRYPHLAVITVSDRRDPGQTYGFVNLPIVGTRDLALTTAPEGRLVLKVGGREFGPFTADKDGKVVADVVVAPGVTEGIVALSVDGEVQETVVDLEVPPSRRFGLLATYESLPADGLAGIPIRAVVAHPDGRPDSRANVEFSSTVGSMSPARHEGNGVYLSTFSPGHGNMATDATILATLQGEEEQGQSDALTVQLVPGRAGSLVLRTEPESLGESKTFVVHATVLDPGGVGMMGRTFGIVANGAKETGDWEDQGAGLYQREYASSGRGGAELLATVLAPASSNPVRDVVVLASRRRLPNDGLSSSMLTIIPVDEFGYPVAGVPVSIKVAKGEGGIPDTAKTGDMGIAQVHYTAGRQAGVVNIQVEAGGHRSGLALLQLPFDVSPDLVPGGSGTQDHLDLLKAWSAIVTTIRVQR